MAQKTYIGVDNTSKEAKKAWIGINNVARKVTKVYIGVNGVAKLVYFIPPTEVVLDYWTLDSTLTSLTETGV